MVFIIFQYDQHSGKYLWNKSKTWSWLNKITEIKFWIYCRNLFFLADWMYWTFWLAIWAWNLINEGDAPLKFFISISEFVLTPIGHFRLLFGILVAIFLFPICRHSIFTAKVFILPSYVTIISFFSFVELVAIIYPISQMYPSYFF